MHTRTKRLDRREEGEKLEVRGPGNDDGEQREQCDRFEEEDCVARPSAREHFAERTEARTDRKLPGGLDRQRRAARAREV